MIKNRSLGATELALARFEDLGQARGERGSEAVTPAAYYPSAGTMPWAFIDQSSETGKGEQNNVSYTVSTAMPAQVYNAAQVTQPTAGSTWAAQIKL